MILIYFRFLFDLIYQTISSNSPNLWTVGLLWVLFTLIPLEKRFQHLRHSLCISQWTVGLTQASDYVHYVRIALLLHWYCIRITGFERWFRSKCLLRDQWTYYNSGSLSLPLTAHTNLQCINNYYQHRIAQNSIVVVKETNRTDRTEPKQAIRGWLSSKESLNYHINAILLRHNCKCQENYTLLCSQNPLYTKFTNKLQINVKIFYWYKL